MKPPIRRRRGQPDAPETQADESAAPESADSAPSPEPEAPAQAAPASSRRKRMADLTPEPPPPTMDELEVPERLSELEMLSRGEFDMAALMGEAGATRPLPDVGTQIRGTILRVGRDSIHVDLGLKSEAWMESSELPDAVVGQEVEAWVVGAHESGVHLSMRLSQDNAAAHLEDIAGKGVPVEGEVTARNKGGYEVKIGSVRAFCPGSHISRIHLADPEEVVGRTLSFHVLEAGDRVILSRRELQEAEIAARRDQVLASLTEGAVVSGLVTRVLSWGAFLDLDGVELTLPRREFSWGGVDDLTTALNRGTRLEVRVKEIDAANDRITVSRKDPDLDPWNGIEDTFQVGQLYPGRVTRSVDFGAFIELAPGLEGLLHVSYAPQGLPKADEHLEVRLLAIDTERRRLQLAPANIDPTAIQDHAPGTEVNGTVTDVKHSGVNVLLDDGRRGWMPAGEVELPAGTILAQRFRRGHTLTARIISVDDRGVTLSQKPVDEGGRSAWAAHLSDQAKKGSAMGTFADLFSKAKK